MSEIDSEFLKQGLIIDADSAIKETIASLSRQERIDMQSSLNADILALREIIDVAQSPIPDAQNLTVAEVINGEDGELKSIVERWRVLIPDQEMSSENWTLKTFRARMDLFLTDLESVNDAPIQDDEETNKNVM